MWRITMIPVGEPQVSDSEPVSPLPMVESPVEVRRCSRPFVAPTLD